MVQELCYQNLVARDPQQLRQRVSVTLPQFPSVDRCRLSFCRHRPALQLCHPAARWGCPPAAAALRRPQMATGSPVGPSVCGCTAPVAGSVREPEQAAPVRQGSMCAVIPRPTGHARQRRPDIPCAANSAAKPLTGSSAPIPVQSQQRDRLLLLLLPPPLPQLLSRRCCRRCRYPPCPDPLPGQACIAAAWPPVPLHSAMGLRGTLRPQAYSCRTPAAIHPPQATMQKTANVGLPSCRGQ